MTKTTLFSGCLLTLMIAVLGCGKDKNNDPTIIRGRITDQKTGQPIEGVSIYMGGSRLGHNGADEYFTQSCPHSDVNGQFGCSLDGDYVGSDITKDGYIDKHNRLDINDGQENDITVQLIPRDGFLRLKIENNTGRTDALYASVYSRTVVIEGRQNTYWTGEVIKEYPLLLNQGVVYTELFDLPSPEFVQIRWGFGQSTLVDSIMVVPNDTATYILSY